ncbi:UbiA family prenyltransferase [Streptomyces clavifer]|uniref:SCO3242 family prenyltransferase n=1 Tax=Streptomyces clavifer TaxID=68188 RepID=UPI002E811595|nr:UbiA family prenyltransferase [Streptomyces clavifer]WUC30975.1 UbiA family prenyltransferase [Streptomyces clavifer]
MRPPRLLAAVAGAPALLGARAAAPPSRLSGAGGTAPAPDRPRTRHTLRAWAELLRVSALFTVPGDALAGAAAIGRRPDRGTALAVGASLCLYEAGMALNDWADREEDAVDRPHRPIPSGRIAPGEALAAAGALTAAGLALAARAGRPALAVASSLAATVWAYDLHLKHTKAGPAAMAAARTLDLLLGATATAGQGYARGRDGTPSIRQPAGSALRAPDSGNPASTSGSASPRAALPAALLLGAHTYAVTSVSRHEAQGGSTAAPLAALAATTALGAAVAHERPGAARRDRGTPDRLLLTAFAGAYLRTAGPPLLHAALNPSPPLTQRAVGGGIRAMIPLQAALAARAGSSLGGLAVMGLVPLARSLARKVSPT